MWTEKGFWVQLRQRGKEGRGVEVVIRFGRVGHNRRLDFEGGRSSGPCLVSVSGGDYFPRASQPSHLGSQAEGTPILFRIIS